MIAAHELGQRAAIVELDPHYADIILARAEGLAPDPSLSVLWPMAPPAIVLRLGQWTHAMLAGGDPCRAALH